jgi:hypothetical protein
VDVTLISLRRFTKFIEFSYHSIVRVEMDLSALNEVILEDLASCHRTYYVTSLLSGRLSQTTPHELILYAYGVLSGQDEVEEFRAARAVRDHERHADCETSKHFWRGVFDTRGTLFMFDNSRRAKKNPKTRYTYPIWRLRGSQLLLSRMYDFFKLYSAFPGAASPKFLQCIEEERGKVELIGVEAQQAAFNLYAGAKIGAFINRADDAITWQPLRGWGIGEGAGMIQPDRIHRVSRLRHLQPIPPDIFDEKRK